MSNMQFQDQLQAYAGWRQNLSDAVKRYQSWLDSLNLADPKIEEIVKNTLDNLQNDRITIAFAAEFSRGKTELINALFFAETGLRLLPSTPGRTTMCPAEIFFDHKGGNYVRLLPIESRLDPLPLIGFRNKPEAWSEIEFSSESPEEMQEAFQELAAVKKVNVEDAKKLGLYHEEIHGSQPPVDDMVEIPRWRHAMISFPHPLLKQGLAILDTPGLNALGSEPELTLSLLPSAQAIVFVLAADTGVTKSDLEMWRNYVKSYRSSDSHGLAVVMNKIDTLWDDIKSEDSINESIATQVSSICSILNIKQNAVFPLTAKGGLLAKIKEDQSALEKSGVLGFESFLSDTVLNKRQEILLTSVSDNVLYLVDGSARVVTNKMLNIKRQLEELRKVDGQSQSANNKLMVEAREEQSRYLSNVDAFQSSRRVFAQQAKRLVDSLDAVRCEEIMARTRPLMTSKATTIGMKNVMKTLLEDLQTILQDAVDSTEETRRLVKAIYRKFEQEEGFEDISPQLFSIKKYQFELEEIFDEAEAFRVSAAATLLEQRVVIDRFYGSIIFRAKEMFDRAHQEAINWASSVMSPILHQIKEQKKFIENRLVVLRKVNSANESVDNELKELQATLVNLQKRLDELQLIKEELQSPMAVEKTQDSTEEEMDHSPSAMSAAG
ncbi:MAG: dynamin family protein [Gammaproteobacteria bacterium]|nr:dynamin family protein [Gammaproteobacteria bacterium]